jgi:tellurium resistance protein TerD
MAGISLEKGQGISLEKEAPGVSKFYIALGWDEVTTEKVDPDVSAFCCKTDASGNPMLYPNNAATAQGDINYGNLVFYNNSSSADGAVTHQGDNLTGKNRPEYRGTPAENDDEAIVVDTARLDPNIDEIGIVITIDKVRERGQTFERVPNSFIRICENDAAGREIATFKLNERFKSFTAVQFGSLIKQGSGWEFQAVGEGYGDRNAPVTFTDVVGQYVSA